MHLNGRVPEGACQLIHPNIKRFIESFRAPMQKLRSPHTTSKEGGGGFGFQGGSSSRR